MFSAKDLFFTPPAGGYTIAKSLRFRSSASAYLSRTPASAGSLTTWTWSAWVKRGAISSSAIYVMLSGGNATAANTNWVGFYNDSLAFAVADGTYLLVSTPVYRDPSAWYHVVAVYDSSNATASNRMKLYVNGVQITAFSTATYPTSSYAGYINGANNNYLGLRAGYSDKYFDGYMAEVNFIDGQALTPSSFGETDTATGVWMPKAYTGTYGTNGFYLKFADASAATAAAIGKDSSSNGNNWTPTNISVTAGVTYDSMVDTPTNYDNGGNGAGNYCVLNPLWVASATLANANLRENAAAACSVFGTMALDGKFYFEDTVSFTNLGYAYFGVALTTTAPSASTSLATVPSNYWIWRNDGYKVNAGTSSALGTAISTGQIGMVAYDQATGKLWFGAQGTWFGSGDPAAGTNPSYTLTAGTSVFPVVGSQGAPGADIHDANFGQRPFTYTPPSGFKALNTQNLPTPTIGATSSTLANKYFDVLTWTGNSSSTGTTRNQTGLSFQPDFVWIKNRSNAYYHNLYDAVRGAGSTKNLVSNTTDAEGASNSAGLYGYLSSFNSDGFQTTNGTDASFPGIWVNQNTQTFVSWNWKANGSGTLNQQGSVNSTVSANVTAGFSVVTYTGTGANATVGHGLGVAPKMVIVKNRAVASNWVVWHTSFGGASNTDYLFLQTTGSKGGSGSLAFWNSTLPTSTVLSIGTDSNVNNSGQSHVAYCFAEVAGYSKFGSYTGNGTGGDGPFCYTGFRPRYLLIKRTDSTSDWTILDSSRDTYNVEQNVLWTNLSSAEAAAAQVDFLANGFKLRAAAGGGNNISGGTYIYAAFAESPFNYARAR